MTWLTLLSFVVALAWGIWLGLPRRYDQPLDEIDERLEEGGATPEGQATQDHVRPPAE